MQPGFTEIPLSGTATYAGHAIGNVSNNGASYIAVREFRQVWNFSNRTGAVNIDSFDGANCSGFTSSPVGNGRDFSGSITGIGGTGISRTGSVDGTFYVSPTSPIAGQGGSFGIPGTNYSAPVTFAAEKQWWLCLQRRRPGRGIAPAAAPAVRLFRRTSDVGVGTEDAAIARCRPEFGAAMRAGEKPDAGIDRHVLYGRGRTARAAQPRGHNRQSSRAR